MNQAIDVEKDLQSKKFKKDPFSNKYQAFLCSDVYSFSGCSEAANHDTLVCNSDGLGMNLQLRSEVIKAQIQSLLGEAKEASAKFLVPAKDKTNRKNKAGGVIDEEESDGFDGMSSRKHKDEHEEHVRKKKLEALIGKKTELLDTLSFHHIKPFFEGISSSPSQFSKITDAMKEAGASPLLQDLFRQPSACSVTATASAPADGDTDTFRECSKMSPAPHPLRSHTSRGIKVCSDTAELCTALERIVREFPAVGGDNLSRYLKYILPFSFSSDDSSSAVFADWTIASGGFGHMKQENEETEKVCAVTNDVIIEGCDHNLDDDDDDSSTGIMDMDEQDHDMCSMHYCSETEPSPPPSAFEPEAGELLPEMMLSEPGWGNSALCEVTRACANSVHVTESTPMLAQQMTMTTPVIGESTGQVEGEKYEEAYLLDEFGDLAGSGREAETSGSHKKRKLPSTNRKKSKKPNCLQMEITRKSLSSLTSPSLSRLCPSFLQCPTAAALLQLRQDHCSALRSLMETNPRARKKLEDIAAKRCHIQAGRGPDNERYSARSSNNKGGDTAMQLLLPLPRVCEPPPRLAQGTPLPEEAYCTPYSITMLNLEEVHPEQRAHMASWPAYLLLTSDQSEQNHSENYDQYNEYAEYDEYAEFDEYAYAEGGGEGSDIGGAQECGRYREMESFRHLQTGGILIDQATGGVRMYDEEGGGRGEEQAAGGWGSTGWESGYCYDDASYHDYNTGPGEAGEREKWGGERDDDGIVGSSSPGEGQQVVPPPSLSTPSATRPPSSASSHPVSVSVTASLTAAPSCSQSRRRSLISSLRLLPTLQQLQLSVQHLIPQPPSGKLLLKLDDLSRRLLLRPHSLGSSSTHVSVVAAISPSSRNANHIVTNAGKINDENGSDCISSELVSACARRAMVALIFLTDSYNRQATLRERGGRVEGTSNCEEEQEQPQDHMWQIRLTSFSIPDSTGAPLLQQGREQLEGHQAKQAKETLNTPTHTINNAALLHFTTTLP